MKQVKLTITKDYVSHWSWWQGLRELIQNAVDTGKYHISFGGGWVPVVVKNTLYQMVEEVFSIDDEVKGMLDFKPLEWLERFKAKHGRKLYSKAKRDLDNTIDMLRIIESK